MWPFKCHEGLGLVGAIVPNRNANFLGPKPIVIAPGILRDQCILNKNKNKIEFFTSVGDRVQGILHGVVRGRITGPYADEFLLPVCSHTHSETWRHKRPQRQAYNQRSQQKQGARFTRVHIYNQM